MSFLTFLIVYHLKTGVVEITEYTNSLEAMRKRFQLENENSDPNIEIATITASSLEALKESHYRYFMRQEPTLKYAEAA